MCGELGAGQAIGGAGFQAEQAALEAGFDAAEFWVGQAACLIGIQQGAHGEASEFERLERLAGLMLVENGELLPCLDPFGSFAREIFPYGAGQRQIPFALGKACDLGEGGAFDIRGQAI